MATMFLDLRAIPSGGFVAHAVTVLGTIAPGGDTAVQAFESRVRGRNIVLATHGFNVNSAKGSDELGQWASLCQLPSGWDFIGVLWPGDSQVMPILDYPMEGSVALASGQLLAQFLNAHAEGAASISLVSHSLGARAVLETVRLLNRRVRTLVLMAGAIEDDCLTKEYASAMKKVDNVQVVASRADWVLAAAFPLGNLLGEIVMHGHPYCREALGREGPHSVAGLQAQYQLWQIPDAWDYGHWDYLPKPMQGGTAPQAVQAMPLPMPVPSASDVPPSAVDGWSAAWSAAVIATQARGV